VQPDRIEAGTFLCVVAATGGDITLTHVVAKDMDATLAKVTEAGVQLIIDEEKNTIQAIMPLDKSPKAVSIRTSPYPGLATDMQAQIMAMNILAQGTSTITETIFENRMMHVPELQRLGAHIQVQGNTAIVTGVEKSTLKGAPVMATDLRASAGLVIAALVSEGKTIIDRIYHLDRGYDHLEEKLTKLGADIQRIHGSSQE
jgi:UDP-N-acetylglucosamine 1-carboxyvinyltransferase